MILAATAFYHYVAAFLVFHEKRRIPMHYEIIINEHAGNGTAKQAWSTVHDLLDQLQADYTSHVTNHPQHEAYIASKLAGRGLADTVVMVIGGDGTLHHTLNGLQQGRPADGQQLPLAYIPAGTGNDFARGYGISLKPAHALQQILAADHPYSTNIGKYTEAIKGEQGYFLNNIGIGFDAAIVSRTNHSSAKKHLNRIHLGRFSYLSKALGVIYDQQPFSLMVQANGHHDAYARAFIVVATNHPFIGGGFQVVDTADINDPQIDMVVAERKNWLQTLWILRALSRGKLSHSKWAHHYHVPKIHYTTTSLEFGQIDGEEMGNRFFDLTVSDTTYPFYQIPEQ